METGTGVCLPARMVNEWVYCPRLFYLEWVQGEWADNSDTIAGKWVHRRVDARSQPLPEQPEGDDEEQVERAKLIARSVWLSDESLKLTARIDLVEAQGLDVTPVEYKRGSGPDGATRSGDQVWDADRAQVGVQVLLLRAHGYRCDKAVVYYAATKTRVTFPVDDTLLAWVEQMRDQALAAAEKEVPPEPLKNSPKCVRCSLAPICLPDEINLLTETVGTHQEPKSGEVLVRRLIPARDDSVPLVVQKHGATVGLNGDCLVVRVGKEVVTEVRILDVSDVAIHGSASVTTPTLKTLLDRGIGVSYFSSGGWFYGMTVGHHHNNILLRDAQYRTRFDQEKSLSLARRFVVTKILNQRTLLRRNHGAADKQTIDEMGALAKRAETAADSGVLLGLEGLAARMYFGAFAGMLKGEWATTKGVFEGRNRRPPKDPINALLSFGYAMLTKDVTLTLTRVGFDPLAGFYHAIRHGKPALALDMMEEFRPLVVDSAVLTAVNTGMVQPKDFVTGATGCALSDSGRRAFIDAYAKRMDELVTHPTFGYRVSYRQVLEVQARLLGRHIMGEIKEFPGFRTR